MQYQKKPDTVQAWLVTKENKFVLQDFVAPLGRVEYLVGEFAQDLEKDALLRVIAVQPDGRLIEATEGEYLVRQEDGQYICCDQNVFERKWEKV